jgi:adenylyl-sulfate kinase
LKPKKTGAEIIWLTGMSGSGKSTHSRHLKISFEKRDYSVKVLDGDAVRKSDEKKLGFSYKDVRSNNLRIAALCNENRNKFDVIIVPVISPYDEIRKEVRKLLSPKFHLIFIKADITSLRSRDPKGLYAAADCGEITNLIGYSKSNPYEIPLDAELAIDTGMASKIEECSQKLSDYINRVILTRLQDNETL